MCVTWVRRYTLCGCIWEEQSDLCVEDEECWGPVMAFLHSNLQTCKECWRRGDKRVDEDEAKRLTSKSEDRRGRRLKKNKSDPGLLGDSNIPKTTDAPGEARDKDADIHEREHQVSGATTYEGISQDAEAQPQQDQGTLPEPENEDGLQTLTPGPSRQAQQASDSKGKPKQARSHRKTKHRRRRNPSRPRTPKEQWDIDPELPPKYLFEPENYCDLTRPCEPVKLSSISRNYRAQRRKTDWYLLQDVFGQWWGPSLEDTDLFDDRNLMEFMFGPDPDGATGERKTVQT
ncbi:uncharacterized protein N7459_001944 [Penicillium hispanicum]|uniref:uncharacterized protein n=1 Tax=Penicillium hispanicum TaxID=1080232 RepID=UPI00253FE331|nr:uncharacterized protein N7459_001944 [Penicillium hispanicum]KAJ5591575.1 hypothetical protein N7459_001944 [Penicillium hispanicum]